MKTTEYVVYRHSSNVANQSMTQTMGVGFYTGTGRTAAERRADAISKAEGEHTVYGNQHLTALPSCRVGAEEQEMIWEAGR